MRGVRAALLVLLLTDGASWLSGAGMWQGDQGYTAAWANALTPTRALELSQPGAEARHCVCRPAYGRLGCRGLGLRGGSSSEEGSGAAREGQGREEEEEEEWDEDVDGGDMVDEKHREGMRQLIREARMLQSGAKPPTLDSKKKGRLKGVEEREQGEHAASPQGQSQASHSLPEPPPLTSNTTYPSAEAAAQAGVSLALQDRPEEAAAAYRWAVASDPRNATLRVGLGLLLQDAGDIEAAAEAYQSALQAFPSDPDLLCGFANMMRDAGVSSKGDAEGGDEEGRRLAGMARECYDKATEAVMALGGGSKASCVLLEHAKFLSDNEGDEKGAEEALRRAEGCDGASYEVKVRLGATLVVLIRTAREEMQELAALNESITRDSQRIKPGVFTGESGKTIPIVKYQELVTEASEHAAWLDAQVAERTEALARLAQEGERVLTEAAGMQPDDGLPLAMLAALKIKAQGDLLAAERFYQQAIDADPACSEAHYGYGELLSERGDAEGGSALLRRAVELEPFGVKFLVALAVSLKEMGRREEGLVFLDRAGSASGEAGSDRQMVAQAAASF